MTRAAGLALLGVTVCICGAAVLVIVVALPAELRIVVPVAVLALLGCGAALWVDQQRKEEGRK